MGSGNKVLMQELSRTFDHYCMQVQGQYYAKPYCIFFSECWNITKNKLIQNFENWGLVYHVEFTLEVTKVPNETWTNVFHFTSKSDKVYYGDRIPALLDILFDEISTSNYLQIAFIFGVQTL